MSMDGKAKYKSNFGCEILNIPALSGVCKLPSTNIERGTAVRKRRKRKETDLYMMMCLARSKVAWGWGEMTNRMFE